jgi:AraC-like DNA-binding protein
MIALFSPVPELRHSLRSVLAEAGHEVRPCATWGELRSAVPQCMCCVLAGDGLDAALPLVDVRRFLDERPWLPTVLALPAMPEKRYLVMKVVLPHVVASARELRDAIPRATEDDFRRRCMRRIRGATHLPPRLREALLYPLEFEPPGLPTGGPGEPPGPPHTVTALAERLSVSGTWLQRLAGRARLDLSAHVRDCIVLSALQLRSYPLLEPVPAGRQAGFGTRQRAACLPWEQIGWRLGFPTPSAFSKYFRRAVGTRAKEFLLRDAASIYRRFERCLADHTRGFSPGGN